MHIPLANTLAMSRFRQLACILAMAATLGHPSVHAEDVFKDNGSRDYKQVEKYTPLPDTSTIGGYAIYRGGRTWRVVGGESSVNNIRLRLGSLSVISPQNNDFFAETHTLVNLSQSNGYFLAEPCKGSHLVAINKGGGQYDNCMTIDPFGATISKTNQTLLGIHIRNSQNGSRIYGLEVFLSLQQLGFPASQVSDWTEQSLAADPAKKALIAKVSAWAEQLQTGVNKAIGYDKPQDAFADVPPLDSLLPPTAQAAL
jgi:hypothetical protein